MKHREHTRTLYVLLAIWLIAVATLTMTACERRTSCPVCGATYLCDCATVETVNTSQTQAPCPICGATYICDCAGDIVVDTPTAPPVLRVTHDSGYIEIDSGNYTWTIDMGNGLSSVTHADGHRPCDRPQTPTIALSALGGGDYMLTLTCDDALHGITVTAYPVGSYEDRHAIPCTMADGKLGVLKGAYYYEILAEFAQGNAIYGFFVQ